MQIDKPLGLWHEPIMTKSIAIIGGGPAGLSAAEAAAEAGCFVTVYEAMPTVGRKFLMAGKSGLNITHSEGFHAFIKRYAPQSPRRRRARAC